ncbi:nucleotide pyrophosphatase [Sulfolobales archaeon HS-7]|nr:nucleotide pyrophosphatase [Sulfolobales archaeon HS-7]
MSLITPNYEQSLYSLACGISNFLGVKRDCSSMNISGNRIVLALLDGFGWSTMRKAGIEVKEARKIHTVFPSTTATVISTLFTAMTPGEHGILGFNTYSMRLGGIVNAMRYTYPAVKERDSIKDSLSFSTAFPSLQSYLKEVNDVKTASVIPKGLEDVEFTGVTHGYVSETKTYIDFWDAFFNLEQTLQKDFKFIYFYIPDIDSLSHKYGPYSEVTLKATRDIFENLYNIAKKHTEFTFLITADHGHMTTTETILLDQIPELINKLEIPPYGDSRAVFLRTRNDIHDYLYTKFDSIRVFKKNEIPSLLGKVNDEKILPDYIMVPTDGRAYIYLFKEKDEYYKLVGHHGGLTPDEFEIPLITVNG